MSETNNTLTPLKREITKPADFTAPEVLFQQLLDTIHNYHPSADVTLVKKAYNIAYEAHKDQKRKSGEPYIIHPLCVAIILAELELDKETIIAGILHDVVEDTVMTSEQITEEFSAEISLLVDGVTKLGKLNYSADKLDIQAENLRKMFLAMAKDIRVILIKLADRLHNMRTMQYMKPHKQVEKSRETMDIYAPIASRLGISKIKVELEDLSLKYLKPEIYEELQDKLAYHEEERKAFIRLLVEEVELGISTTVSNAEVDGRVKHYFSIYRKMVNQNKTIDQIYDIFAIRIKVDTIRDCYAALGIIHEMYKPVPGRFKDYIAMPKPNRYQSLHSTLIAPNGQLFEIQIRTFEMHRIAEYGIAAHWKYKESGSDTPVNNEEEKLAWLREILEWQRDMEDNKEFLNLLKTNLDLFAEQVYCFTPAGDVKTLPTGSTPIDFAYLIHTAVGNKMVGARVNGRQVPINYILQNGDQVDIITSQNSRGPSRDWLKICKSSGAKNKINNWFKKEYKEENIVTGKDMLRNYAKEHSLLLADYMKPQYQKKIQQKYGFRDWDSVLAAVGRGGLKEGQVVNRLVEEYKKDHPTILTDEDIIEQTNKSEQRHQSQNKGGIVVRGIHDVAVRFSRCCNPVPGDEICGFVTRGRGVSIHRTDCSNIISLPENERGRIIDAEWDESAKTEEGSLYTVEVKVFANDRKGLLMDITKVFAELNLDINSVHSTRGKNGRVTTTISFDIPSKDVLYVVCSKVTNVDSVIDIIRAEN